MSEGVSSGFTVALIAGGRSSRLGQDKAFLELGDPPRELWRWQLEKLQALGPAQVLISAREGQEFAGASGVEIIRDEDEGLGPLSGLAQCLAATSQPHLLCLAVDMPLISRTFLQSLLEARQSGQGIAPRIQGRWEGLVALYPRELRESALRRLASEDRSLQGLLREAATAGQMRALEIEEAEEGRFASLNTPEDLREFVGRSLELG